MLIQYQVLFYTRFCDMCYYPHFIVLETQGLERYGKLVALLAVKCLDQGLKRTTYSFVEYFYLYQLYILNSLHYVYQ